VPLIEAADMFPTLEHLVLDAKRAASGSPSASSIPTPRPAPTGAARARPIGRRSSATPSRAASRCASCSPISSRCWPIISTPAPGTPSAHPRHRRRACPRASRERLQLIVIQHEGEIGWCWRQLLRPLLRSRIRKLVEKLLRRGHNDDGGFDTRPGLWRHLAWEEGKPTGWKPARRRGCGRPPITRSSSWSTARKAIIGGLDLDERRWDDRRHRQRANQTWHDISALIEGPAVEDAARHFARLWNRELPRYREIVEEWTDRADAS
jgi:hypothetical protein